VTGSSNPTHPDPFTEIRMLTLHATRGANFWSRRPVTRMDLQIGAYEDISSADVATFTDQLLGALPGLIEHRCSVGTRGGFIERLRTGTYAAHITEHVALELQEMIGHHLGYGRTRGTGDVGGYTLVFEHEHDGVGLRAAALALQTVQEGFAGTLGTVEHAVAELRAIAETPATPPLRQRVACGVTGGTGRSEARDAIATRLKAHGRAVNDGGADDDGDGELVVDVSPSYLLQAGLPYAHSDIAVILDATPTDVVERYRDPERAAQLVSVVADAVERGGWVVCPSDAHYVHDWVRDGGRRVARFVQTDDPEERARRAADAVGACLAHRDGT